MPFHLDIAQPHHAGRIAQIHTGAFGKNALIRAIYPTDEVRRGLTDAVEMKARADIQDPKVTVLIVRNVRDGPREPPCSNIIGFAKWAHPIHQPDEYAPALWNLPEGTDWAVLSPWRKAAEKVEELVVGTTPHYELTYMAVDAQYARQGAGSIMLQWGLDLCERDGYLAYVESAADAVPFYEKHGFEAVAKISLDISGKTDVAGVGIYDEVGCIYTCRQMRNHKEADEDLKTL